MNDDNRKSTVQPISANELQDEFIKRASSIALNSNCKRHKLGTIIVNRKTDEIVSTGYNHYSKTIKHAVTCHSEIDAIQRIRKYPKQKRNELDLYVVRMSNNKMRYAKPCRDCTTAIQSFGIKRIYYSYSECNGKFNKDEVKETYTVVSSNYEVSQKKVYVNR
jgi:deoxycytidylate deaminase